MTQWVRSVLYYLIAGAWTAFNIIFWNQVGVGPMLLYVIVTLFLLMLVHIVHGLPEPTRPFKRIGRIA